MKVSITLCNSLVTSQLSTQFKLDVSVPLQWRLCIQGITFSIYIYLSYHISLSIVSCIVMLSITVFAVKSLFQLICHKYLPSSTV